MKIKRYKICALQGALSVMVLLSLAFSSCAKKTLLTSDLSENEYTEFSLELTPPKAFAAASRITDMEQNAINSVHVLVFRSDGMLISQQPGVISTVGGGISVTAKIQPSKSDNDLLDIMVIGNMPPFDFASLVEKSKDEVRKALTVPIPLNWNNNYFVMYGEVRKMLLKPEDTKLQIQMIRSLACIDIGGGTYDENTGTWVPLQSFRLLEVEIYNTRNQFAVIPNEDALTEDGNIWAPTIPIGTGINNVREWRFGGDKFKSALFVAEAPNDDSRVALVIKAESGIWDPSYYRIDICVPNADKTGYDYLPILRNHLYRINITSFKEGYKTSEQALNNPPLNISYSTTDITVNTDDGLSDIVFNGTDYIMSDASSVLIYGTPDGSKNYSTVSIKASIVWGVSAYFVNERGHSSPIPYIITDRTVTIDYTIPADIAKTGTWEIRIGKTSKFIPYNIQPAISASRNVLTFDDVISITVPVPQPWLTLSQNSVYVESEQRDSYIEANSQGKAYLHIDENAATSGEPRTIRAFVKKNNAQGTVKVFIEQVNQSGQTNTPKILVK